MSDTSQPLHIPWRTLFLTALLLFSNVFATPEKTKPTDKSLFSEAEQQWLSEHPVIKVAPDPYFPPIEWFDKNGEFTGIAAGYLRIVEKTLGVRFEIVKCDSWDDVLSRARNREVDLLSAAAQTPGRAEYLLFTDPHLVFPGVIITRKGINRKLDINDLHGMKVAIVSGYIWQEMIVREHPDIIIDPVTDISTGLHKVSFGMVDAMIENVATATWCIEREAITNLMISGETPYTSRLSFASRKDWPELNAVLRKALAAIDPDIKEKIYRKWIRFDSVSVVRQPVFWISLMVVLVTALVMVLLVSGWNRSLQRLVAQRTAELQKTLERLRESEHKFLEMVENANSIILRMDGEGSVTFFNRFAETFFGFSKDEIIGRNVIGTIVPERAATGDDLSALIHEIGRHPERYKSSENENICKDGSRVWVSWTNKPTYNLNGDFSEILCVGNDITQLKRAQEALARERDFSEAVFQTAGALVLVLDRDGTIVRFNSTCQEISGYRFEEVKGRNCWDMLLPEDEREMIRNRFGKLVEGKNPHNWENRWENRTGEQRLISWYNTVLCTSDGTVEHVVSIGIDITEAREAERRADEALAEAQKRYRFLFEESPAGALIMRENGIITDISCSLADALGYARDDVIGHTAGEFVIEEEREELKRRLHQRFSDEPTDQIEVRVLAHDGSVRTILFSEGEAVLYKDGKPDAVLVAGVEITERKTAEALAKQREQELMHADKMASLGILSSGVAHEINNPNNFIILNADNLRDIWKDASVILDRLASAESFSLAGIPYHDMRDEVPRLIDGIRGGADRIRKIVVNFKDFVRPQSTLMDQEVCLNRVVDAATVIVGNLIRKSTDCFTTSLEPDLPKVTGNMQKIEQVVINLLTNACQALSDRDKCITVSTFGTTEHVTLEVADEGEGITPEVLSHVFDPFFTTRRDSNGTGLGLAISYTIIKEHGGDISVTSEPGKGTRVKIVLPGIPVGENI